MTKVDEEKEKSWKVDVMYGKESSVDKILFAKQS